MKSSRVDAPRAVPRVGVGAMIFREGKVLLGRRNGTLGHGTYGWCGGHLEFGETLEECVTREVLEESGLVVTSLQLLCVSNILAYQKHYIDFEFLAEVALGEPRALDLEMADWNWYDLENLPAPLFKPVEAALHSFKSGRFYNSRYG